MNILFIQAGGTIDKDYATKGKAYNFIISEPAVERILQAVNPSFEYRIVEVAKKDSTDLTDDDRAAIKKACAEAQEDKIIITHGTDTMKETAAALDDISDKVIIITGSMIPERFIQSDASFNIGVAVGALNLLKPGVYIAMSGQVLPWQASEKDYVQGKFVSKKED